MTVREVWSMVVVIVVGGALGAILGWMEYDGVDVDI